MKNLQQTLSITTFLTLKLEKYPNIHGQSLSCIFDYFENKENVMKIKEQYDTQDISFSFTLFSKEYILKAMKSLSISN